MTYKEIREEALRRAAEFERRELQKALNVNGGNITYTAVDLDCAYSTLERAIARHPDMQYNEGRGRPKGT